MRYNESELRKNLKRCLETFQPEIPEELHTPYIERAIASLDKLHDGYAMEFMPVKISAHNELTSLFIEIKLKAHYIYCMNNNDELRFEIYTAAKKAFDSLGVPSPHFEALNDRRSHIWAQIVMEKLSSGKDDLDDIFADLALFIGIDFANNIMHITNIDFYSIFYSNLTEYLKPAQQRIEVETVTDGIEKCVKQYAPQSYNPRPPAYADITLETHPLNAIRNIANTLFPAIPAAITSDVADHLLKDLKPQLELQKNRLAVLNHTTPELAIIGAIRETFVMRSKIYNAMKIFCAGPAESLLTQAISRMGLADITPLLIEYNDEVLVRRATNQIRIELMKVVNSYLRIPQNISMKRESTPDIERTPSPALRAS